MPFVYRATNTLNGKSYIGISKSAVAKRWVRHCSDARIPGKSGCTILWRAIRKYGKARFVVQTLYEATMTPCGYNITAGGQGSLGYKAWAGRKHTPETKAKMSAWQVGKKLSEETKRKISAKAAGRKKTPEEIEEMRRRPFTPEHRAKIKIALKDRYFSPQHRARITEGLKRRWARYREAHA